MSSAVSLLCYIHRNMRRESRTDLQNASILMQQTACFQRLSKGDFSYKNVFKILRWFIVHNVQAFLCIKRGAHTPPNCAYEPLGDLQIGQIYATKPLEVFGVWIKPVLEEKKINSFTKDYK